MNKEKMTEMTTRIMEMTLSSGDRTVTYEVTVRYAMAVNEIQGEEQQKEARLLQE